MRIKRLDLNSKTGFVCFVHESRDRRATARVDRRIPVNQRAVAVCKEILNKETQKLQR